MFTLSRLWKIYLSSASISSIVGYHAVQNDVVYLTEQPVFELPTLHMLLTQETNDILCKQILS